MHSQIQTNDAFQSVRKTRDRVGCATVHGKETEVRARLKEKKRTLDCGKFKES